jgi:ABC-type branched-subunit amino acid transport system ATPase component
VLLIADNVFSGYGGANVLEGVSIQMAADEIITMIGPNGAGKSTLLKTIMGYLLPTSGDIFFVGEKITRHGPEQRVRKGIGYVPQLENVFSTMTVEENLQMGGYTVEKKMLEKRFEEVYSLFPTIREKKYNRVEVMSGGQRQMVAMAQALVTKPKLLLLDEPSAGLAPIVSATVFESIKEIRRGGTAILIVEQDAFHSLEVSDRGYVLALGQNVFEDKAENILNNQQIKETFLGGHLSEE